MIRALLCPSPLFSALPETRTLRSPLFPYTSPVPRLIFARPEIPEFSGRAALCRSASVAAGSSQRRGLDDGPISIELEPIVGEERFDRVLEEARRLGEVIVVLWMADWCRKCIYLKPKLEKLAATYYQRIRFYSIDVNSVPQRFVNRAGVTKMPTVQIWKDCNKQGEVIGGHQAWMVVNDVQQILENQD